MGHHEGCNKVAIVAIRHLTAIPCGLSIQLGGSNQKRRNPSSDGYPLWVNTPDTFRAKLSQSVIWRLSLVGLPQKSFKFPFKNRCFEHDNFAPIRLVHENRPFSGRYEMNISSDTIFPIWHSFPTRDLPIWSRDFLKIYIFKVRFFRFFFDIGMVNYFNLFMFITIVWRQSF